MRAMNCGTVAAQNEQSSSLQGFSQGFYSFVKRFIFQSLCWVNSAGESEPNTADSAYGMLRRDTMLPMSVLKTPSYFSTKLFG
jgi:hypothetical protein